MKERQGIKNVLKCIWRVYVVISIFVVIYLVDHMICKDILEISKRIALKEQWTVVVNGQQYDNVILDEMKFEHVKKGDKVILERMLPAEWEYREESPLREVACEAYRTIFDREPKVEAVHAGLECGYFYEKDNEMDIISLSFS